jgi:hypothetical protein
LLIECGLKVWTEVLVDFVKIKKWLIVKTSFECIFSRPQGYLFGEQAASFFDFFVFNNNSDRIKYHFILKLI